MSEADTAADTRVVLERERVATLQRLATLIDDFDTLVAASRDSNADDEHDPEGVTIAVERSQLDALVKRGRNDLAEIDAASARVDDGTYGTCEACRLPIPVGRLQARPTARTCVGCAPR